MCIKLTLSAAGHSHCGLVFEPISLQSCEVWNIGRDPLTNLFTRHSQIWIASGPALGDYSAVTSYGISKVSHVEILLVPLIVHLVNEQWWQLVTATLNESDIQGQVSVAGKWSHLICCITS